MKTIGCIMMMSCMISLQAFSITTKDLTASVAIKSPGNPSEEIKLYEANNQWTPSKKIPLKFVRSIENVNDESIIKVQISADDDVWFRFMAEYQTDSEHLTSDFYMPGFWYRQNLRSPKEAPSFHTSDSWTVREDRLSTPLTGVYNKKDGNYYTVIRKQIYENEALTTHKEGEVMLSGKSDLGYLGFENNNSKTSLCFGFPYEETPRTYIRKLTLAPATYAFQFLKKGDTVNLEWVIKKGKAVDYTDFISKMWNFSFDTYQPTEVNTGYSDEFVKKTLTGYFRDGYVDNPGLAYTSGEGLMVSDCEHQGGAEVGFVGRVLLNAFNAIEYGEENNDKTLVNQGNRIISDYAIKGLSKKGFFNEYINTRTGFIEDIHSIRRQSEGVYAILLYLNFERKHGRIHAEWDKHIHNMLDMFVNLQNPDGSFPRKFKDDYSIVDNSCGSTSTATLPLLMGYKYFKNKSYLESAKKSISYLEKEIINKADYFSSTLDANCEDKEASLSAATATYYMTLMSKGKEKQHYAELCRKASSFALSWYYTYDVPFAQGQMLGDMNFKSRGWGNVSTENNHIDVFIFEFGNILRWLGNYYNEPRYTKMLSVISSSMKQLLPFSGHLCGVAKAGFYPEVVQHTNWDYGKNGKGYYNDIFAPGWTVASLWELYTPGRTERFLGIK